MVDAHPETALLAETAQAQLLASDPTASAWVSANAGAGKTHVLKLRVLRLLLAGTPPERILCLTYTKAAAAEMAQRVFADLADWSTADEEVLRKTISDLLGTAPTPDQMRSARQLFARAIETPGGLKVQTIHAFCERLLQRFPLEAGVPPGFTILDDETVGELRRESIDKMLTEATAQPFGALGTALTAAVVRAADERFDTVLRAALSERTWLEDMSRLHLLRGGEPFEAVEDFYRRLFRVRDGVTAEDLAGEMSSVVSPATLAAAINVLSGGGKRDQQLAEKLRGATRAGDDTLRSAELASAFLTKQGEPRADSQFVSKAVRKSEPDIAQLLVDARDRFHSLEQERLALHVVQATVALLRLAERAMQHYHDAKARRAALDFEDLIVRTSNLLSQAVAADWILYKLDGGIDHILVDEAQDTSPQQWMMIQSLAAEFYAGEGSSDVRRSVFAVGDEKQSIYSFQGAAPRMFAEAGRRFAEMAENSGQAWRAVPLTLSFRTVEPLLQAVDSIFSDHERASGLTASREAVRHVALRIGQAGRLEIWPTFVPQESEPIPAFAPLDEKTPPTPVRRLAEKIAERIHSWLQNGELLTSQNRPVVASDILVLLRKRQPFGPEIVRALKARGVAVAGADRIALTEQIAIQDLMALGDFLVLPEDDLSLATVLKSPLFDLDDEDLLQFAPERSGTLWSALLAAAGDDSRYRLAAETLKRWRALADFAPPYEFFAALLDRDGCRHRLLQRLGPDAADPIDEFLTLALNYDEHAPVSLQGFLCWLREGNRVIKRDMDQGREEVRVMTVHGAKGLEAPIVILPDTCTPPGSGQAAALVGLSAPVDALASPHAWAIKGARSLAPIATGQTAKNAEEINEHNRLLYVALTRARDRVYVAGFEGKRGRGPNCWFDTIKSGLEGMLEETIDTGGEAVWRLEAKQTARPDPPKKAAAGSAVPVPLPEWAKRRAPGEPRLVIPLAPSRLAPLETDAEGEPLSPEDVRDDASAPVEPAAASPRLMASDNRFLRGLLTHALLEHLPNYETDVRESVGRRFVALRGRVLRESVQRSIVDEALAIMGDPAFAPVFGPDSQAEVQIVAEIPRPEGDGPPLRLTGQIDRLSRHGHEILIVDYKTNRPPPDDLAGVAAAYLLQLAAYRIAIQQVFPDKRVRAAIIWTDGPRLLPIPDEILDDHQQRLWSLKSTDLDGD